MVGNVHYQWENLKIPATERVLRLKERVVAAKPSVCSERALIVTKSYQETEGEPYVLRRAKALAAIFSGITVKINPEELIVGMLASTQRGGPIFPEMGIFWLERELDHILETRKQDPFVVSEKVKADLRGIFDYWRGRNLYEHVWGALPEDVREARRNYVFTVDLHERGGLGHILPDVPKVLRVGFRGIKAEAEAKMAQANRGILEEYQKYLFWQAICIVCDGIITFAERYAAEAERLAECETDAQRRAELLQIAEVCRRVPAGPATTFWEALQAQWFVQLAIQLEANGNAVSPGRADQYWYPYLQADLDAGRLTMVQAQELLDCLWVKYNEIVKVWDEEATFVHAGFPMTQNLTIGGITRKGDDATNLLTFMCLNAQEHIHLTQPHLSLRVHEGTPESLLTRAAEVIRTGGGIPQLVSDNVYIPSLLIRGVELEDARDYACIGCVEVGTIGLWGRNNGGYFNLAKVLELALNNGVDRITGKQVGLKTGDPREFKSIDDVFAAYKKQLDHFVDLLAIEDNVLDMVHGQIMPHIFIDSVEPGCIESGKDVSLGGAKYNWCGPLGVGVANVGDSLAAIKKVVFDDKKVSMDELIACLDSDFKGERGTEVRELLLHAPKYGNDDDYVDYWVREATNAFFAAVERQKTSRGGNFVPGLFSLSVSLPFGWHTGALPDGRPANRPLADGISPSHGMDVKGPTAVMKSVAKLDHVHLTQGAILNVKFTPSALEGENNLRKFVQLCRTYLNKLCGLHVQFNVVSAETLRRAQAHPERYQDLVIRVTGYSAKFIELSREMQDDIIDRTEHAAV
ncbi:glycyl radical protein [Gelria sp. Kuro-4]|uniref:glycyl radical protein n=1 Tax=Gelria sp. Kuro-4 TaxID=2796927 RepID=UPI001BEED783|nr:glycyl radical protein [Gelria sp. Kuro-4]BCV23244.1 glycyl radical enzyme [Gelria sp. Kuro-4]